MYQLVNHKEIPIVQTNLLELKFILRHHCKIQIKLFSIML